MKKKKNGQKNKSDFLRFSIGKIDYIYFQMRMSLQPLKLWLWLGFVIWMLGLLFPLVKSLEIWVTVTRFAGSGHILRSI